MIYGNPPAALIILLRGGSFNKIHVNRSLVLRFNFLLTITLTWDCFGIDHIEAEMINIEVKMIITKPEKIIIESELINIKAGMINKKVKAIIIAPSLPARVWDVDEGHLPTNVECDDYLVKPQNPINTIDPLAQVKS